MNIRRIVLSATLLTALAPAAYAGVLATGPGSRFYPTNQQLDCNILNTYADPKEVTIDVVEYSGAVSTTSGLITLAPNSAASLTDTGFAGAWCRFTVKGSAKKYRAAAVYSTPSGYTSVTPAQ